MWSVEKNEGQNKASIYAMKDGEDRMEWTFRLNQYEVETSGAQHQRNTTCTVEILSNPGPAQQSATGRNTSPLPDGPKMLLGIINNAMTEAGEFLDGDLNVPPKVRSLKRKLLSAYAKNKRVLRRREDR